MLGRIGLLFGVSILMKMIAPIWTIETKYFSLVVNGRSIIMLLGGLFLLYKSVSEIHYKLEDKNEDNKKIKTSSKVTVIIAEIFLLDLIFSVDSVLTAVGIIDFEKFGYFAAMLIIIAAIVVAVAIMLFFSGPVSKFVNKHPTIQMLALSFLILIGVTLLIEAGHLGDLTILGKKIGEIPKGYIYFAIFFSLGVEVLNLKMKKNKN